jgi:aspartyl-tRNA(Asn)/glutamyl-tRNA(Gln) amidotransferase subunit A
MAAARAADAELAAGRDRGPMHGIPYAIKDIYDVAGMPTTCHSRLRLDAVAPRDSAVAARFRAAGAVLLGKLGTYEFALGGPSFDLPFPPPRNPWNPALVPGGSSSGSGAAIAAGYVAVAPGSCTAGSIRGPAAFCGAVGLKPSFGRVSRRGVFPLAWSLDHVGPLTRRVRDAAIALQVMAGHDPDDPGSADRPVPDYSAGLEDGVRGLSIGVPRNFFETAAELTDDARGGIETALACLRDEGAAVADVTLPDHALYLAVGRILMTAEAYAIHRADLRARLDRYGAITARRFAIGAAIGAADYLDAQRLRRPLSAAVAAALARHDVLVTAISLTSPPPLQDGDGLSFAPVQASPFNVTGHPAISVPVGLGRDGMPLAVQVVGRQFDEATVLRVARTLERATGWERQALPG